MKPLVPASYAQFGVGAGGRHELVMPADPGRFPMAWKIRPCFCGDLLLWGNVLPCGKRLRHEADLNLQCGVVRPLRRKRCVQSSLPCVSMRGKRTGTGMLWPDSRYYRFWKPYLQKRLRIGAFCCGKHLDCRNWAGGGLQYGLSGNRVFMLATHERMDQTETACTVTAGSARGKPTRPKP